MERLKEIEERLAQIATEAETDGADLDALESEVRALKEERAAIEAKIEQRKALIDDVKKSAKPVETVEEREGKMEKIETRNTKEYINAFAEYLKTGEDKECRALLSTNATGGTVPVPEYVYDRIRQAWDRAGIMSRVTRRYFRGNLKVGFELSATGAVIHTEGTGAPAEQSLVIGTVELIPESIKKWISISDEIMDLGGEAFIDYIVDEIIYRIAKKAQEVLIGKIITLGTASTANAVGAHQVKASPAIGTIAQAVAQLSDQAANPIVVINKATWGVFKAAQATANYAQDIFEGLDVEFESTLPTYASASTNGVWGVVGDFAVGALANFPNGEGVNIKIDELSLAEQDLVKIVGREYVALDAVTPYAFVNLIK